MYVVRRCLQKEYSKSHSRLHSWHAGFVSRRSFSFHKPCENGKDAADYEIEADVAERERGLPVSLNTDFHILQRLETPIIRMFSFEAGVKLIVMFALVGTASLRNCFSSVIVFHRHWYKFLVFDVFSKHVFALTKTPPTWQYWILQYHGAEGQEELVWATLSQGDRCLLLNTTGNMQSEVGNVS